MGPDAAAVLDQTAADASAGPVLAAFFCGQPTAAAAMVAEHVNDGHGECRAHSHRGRQPWPCLVHTAAMAGLVGAAR